MQIWSHCLGKMHLTIHFRNILEIIFNRVHCGWLNTRNTKFLTNLPKQVLKDKDLGTSF